MSKFEDCSTGKRNLEALCKGLCSTTRANQRVCSTWTAWAIVGTLTKTSHAARCARNDFSFKRTPRSPRLLGVQSTTAFSRATDATDATISAARSSTSASCTAEGSNALPFVQQGWSAVIPGSFKATVVWQPAVGTAMGAGCLLVYFWCHTFDTFDVRNFCFDSRAILLDLGSLGHA